LLVASVARRYARALLDAATAGGQPEKIGAELSAIAAALASPEVAQVLGDPAYSQEQRLALALALARRLSAQPITLQFLSVLVDRQRIADLSLIERAFAEMLDEKVGRVQASVTSALPLDKDDLAKVQKALAQLTRRQVSVEARVDPAILGGVIAEVAGTVYDGSLKTQLERMRETLKRAPTQ